MKRLVALSTVLFLLFGCTSTTIIKSNPPGARLQIDRQSVGETPYFFTDKAVAGKVRTITLSKEGYKEFNGLIRREKLSVPALIGAIFLAVPYLWILEYPSEYDFQMQRL